jgi:hypothetical protein
MDWNELGNAEETHTLINEGQIIKTLKGKNTKDDFDHL